MRPSTRGTASPTATPGRAMVRTTRGGAELPAAFDVRTAFDFAVSLAREVGEHDELPAEDRRWLERARAALPESVRQAFEDELGMFGAALVVERPEITDAAAFVEALDAIDGRTFTRTVLTDALRDAERQTDLERAFGGDEAAIATLLAGWPEERCGNLARLFTDPDGLLGDVRELMRAWLPLYQEVEPRVREIIERDAAARAADAETLRPSELVERTTNGIRWLSEPGVRRVVLAPSYLVRPYNFTFAGGDWRLFIYPVADEALAPVDPLAPPPSVLRLHRALGDDTRLRILRLLRERDWYLTEIAERLELSKPTIKHHLAQLRAAGVVTLTEEGGLSYYSLKREPLANASAELLRYLS